MDFSFYKGKKVLITGHTGFKGTWMCVLLNMLGAEVMGYALKPPTSPSLFQLTNMGDRISSIIGDIRDFDSLNQMFDRYEPEIVIHMAAQPLVRESYRDPIYTYEVNVMGTVHVLEAIRRHDCVRSFVNVTTDKVYQNNEWAWGYREDDILNGYDPYSNSKSCSELITSSYQNSFFDQCQVAISTCRAGNVIGGGDFARDRILPDCVRAMEENRKILVRNPFSVRPYQHVLEPLCAYLKVAEMQYQKKDYAGNYNVGPDECDCVTTGELVDMFCQFWGEKAEWEEVSGHAEPHEAGILKLDCSKIKKKLKWKPRWHIQDAVYYSVKWSKAYLNNEDMETEMKREILSYLE